MNSKRFRFTSGLLLLGIILASLNIHMAIAAQSGLVARPDSYTTPEGVELVVPAPGFVENDTKPSAYVITISSPTTHGDVALGDFFSPGSFTYTPDADFTGTDSFDYQLEDLAGATSTATVTITVTAANQAPVLNPIPAFSTAAGTPLSGQVTATDPNDDPLTFNAELSTSAVTAGGTVVMAADGSFTYTPNNGFSGQDGFDVQVCDNGDPALCDQGTVTVTVEAAAPSPTPQPTVPATTVPRETPEPTPTPEPLSTPTPEPPVQGATCETVEESEGDDSGQGAVRCAETVPGEED